MKDRMKVILSRKGFDSSYGGMPSPVLPNESGNWDGGTLLSLPIPEVGGDEETTITYGDLKYPSVSGKGVLSYADIIGKLSPNTKKLAKEVSWPVGKPPKCHLDPDIRKEEYGRKEGWRGAFGQSGAALSHLKITNKVGKGDLFLFFGWFRKAEWKDSGSLEYVQGGNDTHIIFGYLQIGEIITDKEKVPDWLEDHPHALCVDGGNCIFVAADGLSLAPGLPGYGCLTYNGQRVLTDEKMSPVRRTRWRKDCLPVSDPRIPLTYHSENSWKDDRYFQSASIGQEFVFLPENESQQKCLERWARGIITGEPS